MKVLLTGATGFLGFRTLENLVQRPKIAEVIASGRTLKASHQIKHPKVRYVLGDLSSPQMAAQLVAGADAVIHAAALSSPWGAYADFHAANVLSQERLIAAAQKAQVRRFIYISSPSLYFDFQNRLEIQEAEPLPKRFVNAYAATKRMAELALIHSGLPYVILRPRALIGRGDTVILPRLIKAFEAGRLKIIGRGDNMVDLTSVANAVQAIELALHAKQDALNQVYNISNGSPVLLWDYIERVLNALGYTFVRKKVPYRVVKAVAQAMEWRAKLRGNGEPVLTKYGVGTLALSFTLDISKARQLLGYQPTVSTETAMQEFIHWYQQQS